MRVFSVFCALLLLASCATAPLPSAAPATSAPTAARAGDDAANLLARAGAADAPTQQDVVRAMGQADITRREGVGVALTYRLDHCALLLLFAADARNVMRLQEAHPSARHAGEAAPSLEQCSAEAHARRS